MLKARVHCNMSTATCTCAYRATKNNFLLAQTARSCGPDWLITELCRTVAVIYNIQYQCCIDPFRRRKYHFKHKSIQLENLSHPTCCCLCIRGTSLQQNHRTHASTSARSTPQQGPLLSASSWCCERRYHRIASANSTSDLCLNPLQAFIFQVMAISLLRRFCLSLKYNFSL